MLSKAEGDASKWAMRFYHLPDGPEQQEREFSGGPDVSYDMLPLPPLDGGQIFPALWEAVKKRIARLRGKPDPGPVDAAKRLPVAYVVALAFIGWSTILLVAGLFNPIQIRF